MKRLAIALLIAPSLASAVTYELPNQAGGKIVLEEYVCIAKGGKKYEHLKAMFAVNSSGKRISGCWYYSEGYVHVIYTDNTEYTYNANNFRLVKDNNL